MRRRRFLACSGGLAAATATAGCLGDGGGQNSGGPDASYGDWFDGVDDYDGETDLTGQGRVTVAVGTGSGLQFDPVAIRISPGTTVTWEWTGKGGRHNVVAESGAFESEFHDDEGATYERAFDTQALFKYFCEPHRSLGMKGGVRVVEG